MAAVGENFNSRPDIIYLDITSFILNTKAHERIVEEIQQKVISELKIAYPEAHLERECVLADALFVISQLTGKRFIIIIDEWDALFRETQQDRILQKEYVNFLRNLFKNGQTTDETIAAAYMTGILPIKKYGTESALTDFREFTMTAPGRLAEFIGFTESEVKELCDCYHMDLEAMHQWYDGYSFSRVSHVYSPNSVMNAVLGGEFLNYWTSSETYEALKKYISMNFDGLKNAVVSMLGGESVSINTLTFQNDMTSMQSRDDVLTLLIHLGYLSYDEKNGAVRIPNLEVSEAFKSAIQGKEWKQVRDALQIPSELHTAVLPEYARCS